MKDAAASGRNLREVALEKGVDAKVYAEAMNLKKMALGE